MTTKIYTTIAAVLLLLLTAHSFAFFWFIVGGLVIGNNPLQWYWDLFGIAPIYSVLASMGFIFIAWILAINNPD